MAFEILDFKTHRSIEVDYDTKRDCNSYGCDGICRCGTLINMEITDINVDYSDFTFSRKKGMKTSKHLSEVDKYCLNRLIVIHGGYNKESYDPVAVNGYYGEELGETDFSGKQYLIKDAQEMLNLETDIEKVFFVLGKEYSFIGPVIANCTNVKIIKVQLRDIKVNNGTTMLKAEDNYLYNIESDEVKGILYGNENLLIDGNYRYSHLITQKGIKSKTCFSYLSLSQSTRYPLKQGVFN